MYADIDHLLSRNAGILDQISSKQGVEGGAKKPFVY